MIEAQERRRTSMLGKLSLDKQATGGNKMRADRAQSKY